MVSSWKHKNHLIWFVLHFMYFEIWILFFQMVRIHDSWLVLHELFAFLIFFWEFLFPFSLNNGGLIRGECIPHFALSFVEDIYGSQSQILDMPTKHCFPLPNVKIWSCHARYGSWNCMIQQSNKGREIVGLEGGRCQHQWCRYICCIQRWRIRQCLPKLYKIKLLPFILFLKMISASPFNYFGWLFICILGEVVKAELCFCIASIRHCLGHSVRWLFWWWVCLALNCINPLHASSILWAESLSPFQN